jgi:hypothetical protein
MCSTIVSFLLGVGGAVVGWFVTSFFAKPLIDFLNLRSQVHEEIIFTNNVDKMVDHKKANYEKAVETLRHLGAKVQATNENVSVSPLFLPLRWCLSTRGYDLRSAGRSLIGLSNSLIEGDRAAETRSIQAALKLPPAD